MNQRRSKVDVSSEVCGMFFSGNKRHQNHLLETNISPPSRHFQDDDFPFPVWCDMDSFPGGYMFSLNTIYNAIYGGEITYTPEI